MVDKIGHFIRFTELLKGTNRKGILKQIDEYRGIVGLQSRKASPNRSAWNLVTQLTDCINSKTNRYNNIYEVSQLLGLGEKRLFHIIHKGKSFSNIELYSIEKVINGLFKDREKILNLAIAAIDRYRSNNPSNELYKYYVPYGDSNELAYGIIENLRRAIEPKDSVLSYWDFIRHYGPSRMGFETVKRALGGSKDFSQRHLEIFYEYLQQKNIRTKDPGLYTEIIKYLNLYRAKIIFGDDFGFNFYAQQGEAALKQQGFLRKDGYPKKFFYPSVQEKQAYQLWVESRGRNVVTGDRIKLEDVVRHHILHDRNANTIKWDCRNEILVCTDKKWNGKVEGPDWLDWQNKLIKAKDCLKRGEAPPHWKPQDIKGFDNDGAKFATLTFFI